MSGRRWVLSFEGIAVHLGRGSALTRKELSTLWCLVDPLVVDPQSTHVFVRI